MVGNPLTFGMIIFGIAGSMAPKDTPFVAYVTRPKITSMFAMVDMNGCILNLAVKKPPMDVKHVQSTIHINSANTTLKPMGMPVKSNTCPKTEPVLIPWCMMMVAVVIPMPTINIVIGKQLYILYHRGSDTQPDENQDNGNIQTVLQ